MSLEPLERLLDTRSVSVLLCISVEMLARWRQRRIGPPYIKLEGGAVRYRLSDLNDWVRKLKAYWRPDPIKPWEGVTDKMMDRLLDGWERAEEQRRRRGW